MFNKVNRISRKSSQYYIGLMSGTSMDGIDAVIANFEGEMPALISTYHHCYPDALQKALMRLSQENPRLTLAQYAKLDHDVGEWFATAVQKLMKKSGLAPQAICAIGSHGQTIRHQPNATPPFTLQIGDPNIIVARTGMTTITDFRRGDVALSGQGAPLTPAFHKQLFSHPDETRIILNIGGFTNVTVLKPGHSEVIGFDTGPGNVLFDIWCQRCQGKAYDSSGRWAASGTSHPALLDTLLNHPFFTKQPPKSTGKADFNQRWLEDALESLPRLPDADIQATLVELTAVSLNKAIKPFLDKTSGIFLCGGGVHNRYLCSRIKALCQSPVQSTQALGVAPDWLEAMAFAWLAKQRLEGKEGNIPSVTGAVRHTVLGGVYSASGVGACAANEAPQPHVV